VLAGARVCVLVKRDLDRKIMSLPGLYARDVHLSWPRNRLSAYFIGALGLWLAYTHSPRTYSKIHKPTPLYSLALSLANQSLARHKSAVRPNGGAHNGHQRPSRGTGVMSPLSRDASVVPHTSTVRP